MLGSLSDLAGWLLIAVGGALFAGTGAALIQRRRTGRFPRPASAVVDDQEPGAAPAVVKCGIGLVMTVGGVITLLNG